MQCNNNPEGNLHNLLSYIENTPFWLQFWCDTRRNKRAFSICLSDDILDLVQLQARCQLLNLDEFQYIDPAAMYHSCVAIGDKNIINKKIF